MKENIIYSDNIHNHVFPQIEKKINMVNLVIGIVAAIAGIVAFILGSIMFEGALSTIMYVLGIALVVLAAVLLCKMRMLVYQPSGAKVKEKKMYFDATDFFAVRQAVEQCNAEVLSKCQIRSEGNVELGMVCSCDGKFMAMQVLKFVPFEYQPQTDIIFPDADTSVKLLKLFR